LDSGFPRNVLLAGPSLKRAGVCAIAVFDEFSRGEAMRTIWQDVNFALRILRKNPGFTAVAIFTLALGIGANTAIFSVVNAVLLQPLPYRDSGRLLSISQVDRQNHVIGIPLSYTKFTQIQEQSRALESAATYYALGLALATQHEPEVVVGAHVSQSFFDVLGVHPARGRTFLPEEQKTGGPDVAVVSDGFWHSYFAGEESLLGRTLTLDGKNVTVVGILPASFQFPLLFPEPSVWLPREFENGTLRPEQIQSGAGYLSTIARLGTAQSVAHAQAELDTINSRYRAQFGSYVDATKYDLSATSLEESLVSTLRPSLLVLLAAVGFVLLIACANVANLLLARATGREREIAIRRTLGASRLRLVRQLLIESLLLSLGGAALGVFLSSSLLPLVRSLNPGTFPRIAEARVDAGVLLFSLALCVVTGIIFGLAPSLQTASKSLQSSLREGGRGSSEGGSRGRFRSLLVVAEMGIALVLMTGAGLLIESFAHLVRVDPGFSPKNLMTFPINLPTARYPQAPQQADFYRQVLERVKSLPEVQAAGATSYLPLSGAIRFVFFCPEGVVCQGVGKDPLVAVRQVTPDYFDTARTALLSGRVFTERDAAGGQPVVIVNETTAKRYWPDQNAVGKHVANSRDMIQREVVGVVADVKFNTLSTASSEEMYLPLAQSPWPAMTLLVRWNGDSRSLVSAMRAKIAEVDPTLPVSGILSMEDVVSASVAQPRLIVQLVGVFAGLALLLSAIGIYGVMAYSVTQRKQELGIRVALGADPRDILRLVVGQGMKLALIGVVLGVLISLLLTRLLSSLLFGVHAIDPIAFAGSAVVLAVAAFAACYLPARRATRVDPIVVLRFE
jgi:putative ABC transport system permease protein